MLHHWIGSKLKKKKSSQHQRWKNSAVDDGINEFIEYLQNLRIETSGNLLIGHLNINSIRNKIDMLTYMIENKIDILMI